MSEAEKPKYLIRRDGSLLTLGDLPCPKTKRWVIRRKAVVVDAVRGGLITVQDACLRYSLTPEEFFAWRRAVEQFGTEALSPTRAQGYRRAAKKNGAPPLGADHGQSHAESPTPCRGSNVRTASQR